MRAVRTFGFAALASVLFADFAVAQSTDDAGTLSLLVENDLFGAGTDRHFTNGLKVSYTTQEYTPEQNEPLGFIADLIPFWPSGAKARATYSLGQNIYTPEDISQRALQPDDRPYAGWLYLGGGLIVVSDDGRQSDAMILEVGMVGPASLAAEVQTRWHEAFDFQEPRGWDNQLENEPGIVLTYEHQRQIYETPLALGLNADAVPNVGFALGNIATYLSGGLTVRVGRDLSTDLGPPRIRPSLPGSSYIRAADGFNWYTFASLGARLVGRNIFLDGNTFTDSHSVDKRPVVADFQTGIAMQYQDWRFAYTYVIRSEEFVNQDQVDRFGSINISYRF